MTGIGKGECVGGAQKEKGFSQGGGVGRRGGQHPVSIFITFFYVT